jgi:Sec-independent protein translocase protein TatA
VLLGPDKLPEVFRTLGKVYYEYQKAKKRFELEVLYGYKLPDKDSLDKLSMKKIDELIKSELELKEGNEDAEGAKLPNEKDGGKMSRERSQKDTGSFKKLED